MELEKAVKNVKKFNEQRFRDCGVLNQSIDTVLEELNNSIPIKKIKKVLEKLDERAIYPDKCNYYARLTVSEALFLKHFIENEILNKE